PVLGAYAAWRTDVMRAVAAAPVLWQGLLVSGALGFLLVYVYFVVWVPPQRLRAWRSQAARPVQLATASGAAVVVALSAALWDAAGPLAPFAAVAVLAGMVAFASLFS
ncbi:hypothetical protein HK405_013350, partial [Cladochytrium tenue]